MQKSLVVGLSIVCFTITSLNTGLDLIAWGGSAQPSEGTTLRVGLPFLFTNQPADPARGGGLQLIADGLAETLWMPLPPMPWAMPLQKSPC